MFLEPNYYNKQAMLVSNIKNLIPETNIIVFSPHYDDFVLLIGSYIFELIENKILHSKYFINVNIFSRSNYQYNDKNGNEDTSLKRIKFATGNRLIEDLECLDELLGPHRYNYRILGELESLLRGKFLADSEMEFPHGMYEDFNKLDQEIFSRVKGYIKEYAQIENTAIILPLGFKEHIDHFIVREAGISIARSEKINLKAKFYFAEDKPYSGISDDIELLRIENFVKEKGLKENVFKHHPQKLIDIVFKHYTSQVEEIYSTGINNRNEFLKQKYNLAFNCDCIYPYNS